MSSTDFSDYKAYITPSGIRYSVGPDRNGYGATIHDRGAGGTMGAAPSFVIHNPAFDQGADPSDDGPGSAQRAVWDEVLKHYNTTPSASLYGQRKSFFLDHASKDSTGGSLMHGAGLLPGEPTPGTSIGNTKATVARKMPGTINGNLA